jgi:hypothetical protein
VGKDRRLVVPLAVLAVLLLGLNVALSQVRITAGSRHVTLGRPTVRIQRVSPPLRAVHTVHPTRTLPPLRLPSSSPWALPPVMHLHAHPAGTAHPGALRARVLHSPRLLLSPAAHREIAGGRVGPGALSLLLHMPRVGSPLLVFAAHGDVVRVQETTLWMTRRALRTLVSLPAASRPSEIRMSLLDETSTDRPARHGGVLGAQAVAIAERYLGIPYVWGGASPTGGFDCSGLMMYVYAKLGIRLDHYAAFQFYEGTRVPVQDLQPGDLVFFEPHADGPGHVGMYIGNGQMIHAPHTGDVVRVSDVLSVARSIGYMGAVRPY